MMDSVVAVFPDRLSARHALERLAEDGWPTQRLSMKRVVRADFRGLGDGDAAHALMHSPEMEEPSTLSDDAGTVIAVVRLTEEEDADDVRSVLSDAGAEETQFVEGTPPFES